MNSAATQRVASSGHPWSAVAFARDALRAIRRRMFREAQDR